MCETCLLNDILDSDIGWARWTTTAKRLVGSGIAYNKPPLGLGETREFGWKAAETNRPGNARTGDFADLHGTKVEEIYGADTEGDTAKSRIDGGGEVHDVILNLGTFVDGKNPDDVGDLAIDLVVDRVACSRTIVNFGENLATDRSFGRAVALLEGYTSTGA